ncbi:hypothetical protein PV325_009071 [Microctonus aethiopoides]|nr:hypothetical protein PV325_009071 [Microctonus aethiopoides]
MILDKTTSSLYEDGRQLSLSINNSAKPVFGVARPSPVNIVATATVVTSGDALLDDEEDDDVDEGVGEVESVGTEKSGNVDDDEEIDIDVEECSSVDDGHVGNDDHHSNRKYNNRNNNSKRKFPPRRRTSCNSDELRNVECHLETKDLWDKFNELGTEMIITKTGR